VVEATGGTPRKLVEGDAVQASWSPSNDRIVYWSNNGGQRDLFTVAASGGTRVQLTNDPALDWSPVWSPDGRFVYFSSDRGGAMNLWRIPLDQASGRAEGAPIPVTTGVQASASLPGFSRNGARLAFRSRVSSINPVAIPFDPAINRAGVPVVLDGSNNVRVPSDVSPDGSHIAYYSIGERQEDIFIGGADGKGIRRVTDDSARDRSPMFARDGQSIVFYSNRDGAWAIWTIRIDGSNLRKLAGVEGGVSNPVISPLDSSIVFTGFGTGLGLFLIRPSGGSSPTGLPGTKSSEGSFYPTGWSRDGKRLCGTFNAASGRAAGVGVYDFQAHNTTVISTDGSGGPKWLPDSRHLIYFNNATGELIVVDSVTRQRSVVSVQLPGPPANEAISLSRDGRTIYYGAVHAEADIWIAERK